MAAKYVRSGAAGAGTGADWANAYTTLTAAIAGISAGDDLYVSEDHSESTGGAVTLNLPGTAASPNRVLCVNHAGTVPPVSADLTTGAVVATTGNNDLNVTGGRVFWQGIKLQGGDAAGSGTVRLTGASGAYHYMKNCTLKANATAGNIVFTGATTTWVLDNTPMAFTATGQAVFSDSTKILWKNTASAISGTLPTTLIQDNGGGARWIIDGVDFSAKTSGTVVGALSGGGGYMLLKDCKFGAGATKVALPTAYGSEVNVIRGDSSGTNYVQEKYTYSGKLVTSTGVIRTGGASDGTTGISWAVTGNANTKFAPFPFEGLPIAEWNDTSGSAVTVTMEGVASPVAFSALPKDNELWFDVSFLGASGSPLASLTSSAAADVLNAGTALTASTQAWDTQATARANTTAYLAGDVIKLASNAGRIFICTTAGTTAGSEPAGYASAVDGDSVTDNTATFKAAWRFKKAITLTTPGQKGALYVTPKFGKTDSSGNITVYLDPKATLS